MQTLSDLNRTGSNKKKKKPEELSNPGLASSNGTDVDPIVIDDDDFRDIKKIKPNPTFPSTEPHPSKSPAPFSSQTPPNPEEVTTTSNHSPMEIESKVEPTLINSRNNSDTSNPNKSTKKPPEKPLLWINKLRYYPNEHLTENMISFKEIMFADLLKNGTQHRDLESAFMTTFGYSIELIEPLLQAGVKVFLADEYHEKDEGPPIERKHLGWENFTLIKSPKVPTITYGAFHPKIWLLKFPKFLRVVVTSGNLTIGDWTIWSNCLWFQDFPLREGVKIGSDGEKRAQDSSNNNKNNKTAGGAEYQRYIKTKSKEAAPEEEEKILKEAEEDTKMTSNFKSKVSEPGEAENENKNAPKQPKRALSLKELISKNNKTGKEPQTHPEAKKEDESEPFDYDKDFKEVLTDFLQRLMPPGFSYKTLLKIDLDDYHFSDIDIILIPSVVGRHRYKYTDKYGHRRVANILKRVAPHLDYQAKKLILTYQTSSVGTFDAKYFRELLSSFFPNYLSIEDLKNEKKSDFGSKKDAGKKGKTAGGDESEVVSRVRMIYPTLSYVKDSYFGAEGASCLLLGAKNFQRETFPKKILHKFEGAKNYPYHQGCIGHIKVFVINGEDDAITDDTIVYFGSHNFSPGAWGRYEREYSQLMITNTELGVMLPPRKGSKERKRKLLESLPFRYPPKRYEAGDHPFIWDMHYQPEDEKDASITID